MRERRLRFRVATLVAFFLLLALPSMSQGTKEKGITMEFRNEELPLLFKRIEKASDFRVIFIYEDVSKYRSTGKITNASVDKAMKAIIGNHPLKYHIDGKFINVSRKQVKMLKEVKGMVLSDNDGHPVPGATVAVEGTQQQTITDANVRQSMAKNVVQLPCACQDDHGFSRGLNQRQYQEDYHVS